MTLRISYELNSALEYRQENRIFGNIDNQIRKLTATEIVSHEMDRAFSSEKMKGLFEQDSTFYKELTK